MIRPDTAPRPAAARANDLLSRYAESIVWLARYMERIENLARILDVTETFTRTGHDGAGWRSVVQINADEERFFRTHDVADAVNVIHFYVLDAENPTSIATIAGHARENARTLRPLISTEMWTQINIFRNWVSRLGVNDVRPSQVSALCARLKQECQTHYGITEGTFFRDQGWYFYLIGKYLERGDQTTRLVDIKYHTLLPVSAGVGSQVDISQWSAVLRAAAGYHAYRRTGSGPLTPGSVAGFLLLNNGFPRSLALTLRRVHGAVTQLRTDYGLRRSAPILERLEELRAVIADQGIDQIILRGLHEFCDWVQLQIQALHNEIAATFWPPAPALAPTTPEMTQRLDAADGAVQQMGGGTAADGMVQTMGGMTQRLAPWPTPPRPDESPSEA